MPDTLLVLGGSGFVGPAVVREGLARGLRVTTFHRGAGGVTHPDVETIRGDRLDPATLAPLRERAWDVVVDTWSAAPRAVRDSARALSDHAGRYVYISSESVYRPPPVRGADESTPTVEGDPDAEATAYPEDKRGGEIAVEQAFADRALLARCGVILGPLEDVGRLTWWLGRMARGGEVLCPGPAELPLQYIDARDLAAFAVGAALAGHAGPFNLVSRRGHATMGTMLEACSAVAGAPGTTLTWVDSATVQDAGIEPWTELPIWLPAEHEYAAMHDSACERAHAAGLRCRPVLDTAADTWRWLSALDAPPPLREGAMPAGLAPEREAEVLRAWARRATG
ncbi:MAG TPA: NAD-dependent epimerase/dehydratase family protein [Solirubrobacteraceae bacterium]|nr:NAD-dependent epimerase/dehydratase family protein [Solirubrobacteraceae bacterium]